MKYTKLLILLIGNCFLFFTSLGQCELTIQPKNSGTASIISKEEAVWTDIDNINTNGNDLSKSAAAGWNSGAISTSSIYNNGYIKLTATEANKRRMVGLSDNNTTSSYTDIDYAIYLQHNAVITIYESGSNKGTFGTYTAGDSFKVAVEDNIVIYYHNEIPMYTSTATPTLPMTFDASLYDVGATVTNVIISNGTDDTLIATSLNGGTGTTYEWTRNGVVVDNDSIYDNVALSHNDTIICIMTSGAGSCAGSTDTANSIIIDTVHASELPKVWILNDPNVSIGCSKVREEVVWWNLSNVVDTGNNITKVIGGDAQWYAGAASKNKVYDNGYLEFIAEEDDKYRMIGLDYDDANNSYATLDYAIYLYANGTYYIYESGSNLGVKGAFSAGDTFRVAVEDSVVLYYHNGNPFYTSLVAPSLPLLADNSIRDEGGTVKNAYVINNASDTFRAYTFNAGSNPTYQWQVNGANIGGATNSFYVNNSLSDGDTVTCLITTDLNNFSSQATITSNIIIKESTSINDLSYAYIYNEADNDSAACSIVIEDIAWRNISNLSISGNDCEKTSGGAYWGAGASSYNPISNNGYTQAVTTANNERIMFGLTSNDANSSYTTIDFAIYLQNNGYMRIYESGANIGQFGQYSTGDTIKVAIEDSTIIYYVNNNPIYTSSNAPTLPLYTDMSFFDEGAALEDITIVHSPTDTFRAVGVNMGESPTYQWQLNSVDIGGATSSFYVNGSLNNDDTLSCVITSSLNCSPDSLISNYIFRSSSTLEDIADVYITNNTPSDKTCVRTREEIKWNDLSHLQPSGNDIIKTSGGASWEAGAVSYNQVSDNGFVQTIVDETNTRRMFGLNIANTSASYQDIDFAMYLSNNGYIYIYENGASKLAPHGGRYYSGDTMQVAIESGVVKYYRNNDLVYTSLVVPSPPLYVDVSMVEEGATLRNINIFHAAGDTFTVGTHNVGSSPTYQWQLNGVDIGGATSSTYVNNGLSDGDSIRCKIISTLNCDPDSIFSNYIIRENFAASDIVNLYISNDATATNSCLRAREEAFWTDNVYLTISGNNVEKTSGNNASWDAAAITYNQVSDYGYIETIVDETDKYRMFGLNDANTTASFQDIDYAIYLITNGTIQIYESGTYRGIFATYTTGDTLKVAVEDSTVIYYKNNVKFYTSAVAPTLPMFGDLSIRDTGGTFKNVMIAHTLTDTFRTTLLNDAGSSPTYQWQLNGADIGGATSSFYEHSGLDAGDTITCKLFVDLNCDPDSIYSPDIVIEEIPINDAIEFYIYNDSTNSSACRQAIEEVTWADIADNVSADGNNLIRTYSSGWNAGAVSTNYIGNGGYVQTIADETNTARMFGLSNSSPNDNYTSIDFALYLTASATVLVYESGAQIASVGSYATGDTFKVSIEDDKVYYYKNGDVLYESTTSPTLPMLVDLSLNTLNSTLKDVTIVHPMSDTFRLVVNNAESSLSYQWKLNGTNIPGATDIYYANNSLSNNDTITCLLSTGLDCEPDSIESNTVVVHEVPLSSFGSLYIENDTSSQKACKLAKEEVRWTDLSAYSIADENDLTKAVQSAWNGGAASTNQIQSSGYVSTVIEGTNTYRAIGLSNGNINDNWNTIDYCFYLHTNGIVYIYESGTSRGAYGAQVDGDTLKVQVINSVVTYYRNDSLLYTSAVSATMPLLVDASIYSLGATLKDVYIAHELTDTFRATVSNAGNNPTYQWQVNGINQGANSPTYANSSLNTDDVIRCIVTPDLNCSNGDTTAPIVVDEILANNFLDIQVTNDTTSTVGCKIAEEQVIWTDIVSCTADSNDLIRNTGSGWNGGAASSNIVTDWGYLYTVAGETNTQRMIGLSSNNTDANYTTIDFAFYLQSNSNVAIYESGSNRGNYATYTTGDTLKIAVENSVIKYYKNSELIYISEVAPILPLIADASINSTNGTLKNCRLAHLLSDTFRTTISAEAGVTYSYQWKKNGVDIAGANSDVYGTSSLDDGDQITCDISIDLNCTDSSVVSSPIIIKDLDFSKLNSFYIANTIDNDGSCKIIENPVTWTNGNNIEIQSNNIRKTAGTNNSWDAGAESSKQIEDWGYVQTIVFETNENRMIGLSQTNTNDHHNTIDFAIYLASANYYVYESGANVSGLIGGFSKGDTFKVQIEDDTAHYYRNGTLFYTSTKQAITPMVVDVSLYGYNATLRDVTIGHALSDTFEVRASNIGASPTYQWKIDGVDVGGETSSTYINTSLGDNEVVSCLFMPDIGCTNQQLSNEISIQNTVSVNSVVEDVYITNGTEFNCNQYSKIKVLWDGISTSVTQSNNGNLSRTTSSGWNAGAYSKQTVANNGFVQTIVNETNRQRMFGLSNSSADDNYTTIAYAIYLHSNANIYVYESGVSRGGFGTYSSGDTVKVAVENDLVHYYKNGVKLYTSSVTPTLPMIVDLSLNTNGATLQDVMIYNGMSDTSYVFGELIGNDPSYQWKLNGGNVGIDTNFYVNTSPNDDDMITCEITTDLECASTDVESDTLFVIGDPVTSTNWLGTSTTWFDKNNWSNGIPNYKKSVVIPNGTPSSPTITSYAAVYDLEVQTGATLNISGSNTLCVTDDYTNRGTINSSTGTVIFTDGCQMSTDTLWNDGVTQIFDNFTMDNENGLVIDSGSIEISGTLTFTNGIIYSDSNNLVIFEDDANHASVSNSSFVDGYVRKIGDDAFTFPVGDSGYYQPISITAPSSTSDHFTAKFFAENYFPTYYSAHKDTDIAHTSSCNFWTLDRTNGSSDVTVTLSWSDSNCTNGSDVTDMDSLIVCRYNGSKWVSEGNNGSPTGDNSSGTITSAAAITSFSPFVLGTTDPGSNPLPIELLYFYALPQENNVEIYWGTASEVNNAFFSIERSADGQTFEELKQIEANGSEYSKTDYQEVDYNPLAGIAYYRLKQTDDDGSFSYSNIIKIDLHQKINIRIFPVPAKEKLNVVFKDGNMSESSISIKNILGQKINVDVNTYGTITQINTKPLKSGIYILEVQQDAHTHEQFKFVVE